MDGDTLKVPSPAPDVTTCLQSQAALLRRPDNIRPDLGALHIPSSTLENLFAPSKDTQAERRAAMEQRAQTSHIAQHYSLAQESGLALPQHPQCTLGWTSGTQEEGVQPCSQI